MDKDGVGRLVNIASKGLLKPSVVAACEKLQLPKSGTREQLLERITTHLSLRLNNTVTSDFIAGLFGADSAKVQHQFDRHMMMVQTMAALSSSKDRFSSSPHSGRIRIPIPNSVAPLPLQSVPSVPPSRPRWLPLEYATALATRSHNHQANSEPPQAPLIRFPPTTESDHVPYLVLLVDPFFAPHPAFQPVIFKSEQHRAQTIECPGNVEWRREGLSLMIRGLKIKRDYSEFSIHWQRSLTISVNQIQALEVSPPKPLKARRDDPIDLTMFLRPGKNLIEIRTRECFPQDPEADFWIVISLERSMTDQEVIRRVVRQDFASCKSRIQTWLSTKQEDGLEVAEPQRILDLRCPVSQSRITVPVRGVHCQHIRCLDLASFVFANRHTTNHNKRWKCPTCRQSCKPHELRIDEWVQDILKNSSSDSVAVFPDGRWERMGEEEEKTADSSEHDETEAMVIDLTSDEDRLTTSFETQPKRPRLDLSKFEIVDLIDCDSLAV